MHAADGQPRRRQARGERRIAEILDAAAVVFGDVGYEKATTNAIATAAGISPGSLYQFFPNKEAIAQALADRFVEQMGRAHRDAFERTNFATVDLDELLDRVIDPILAFNLANPGFKALFARPDMPAGLTGAAAPIQAALLGRVESVLAARAPALPTTDRTRAARTLVQVFKGLLPVVLGAPAGEREVETREMKKVLRGYLAPITG
ncbi:TetR/AcrR family transcriptional regulator [Micromonospora sp. WMMD1082]|uniref:TetR/AcrR family transcriptional regulator n=1 Tax=Micromonospora sp. WMMD1082 TaxID=3016104 RepID=UPI0024168248|nr:TetR/AcrR family transcriptional regulator [Micromonospora sp. WMMD1082]MDG4796316.1 TetR/AcrR family transcriptional regulator [Micromonospora sp. WMMD1082]